MQRELHVAGVVVLFNPPKNVIENINSYINQVDFLWIIDNSSCNNYKLFQSLESYRFSYLPNYNNIGVAAALNIAAHKVIKQNFGFLLTMDQDSYATENMIKKMIRAFTSDDIGIISAHQRNKFESSTFLSDKDFQEVSVVMTSGNLVNLSVYQKIGGFNEDLFIDYVDHEYCLRLLNNNFRIIKVNDAILNHTVGNTKARKLGFVKFYLSNHDPIRHYYQTRNRFYLKRLYKIKYPSIFKYDMKLFRNNIIKIIFFEKEKIKKLGMIVLGYKDYINNKFGKF